MQIQPTKFYAAASAVARNVQGPFDTVKQAQAIAGMRVYAGAELLSATGEGPSPYTAVSKAGGSKGHGKGGSDEDDVMPNYGPGAVKGGKGPVSQHDAGKGPSGPRGSGGGKGGKSGKGSSGMLQEDLLDDLKGCAQDLPSLVKRVCKMVFDLKSGDIPGNVLDQVNEALGKASDLIEEAIDAMK